MRWALPALIAIVIAAPAGAAPGLERFYIGRDEQPSEPIRGPDGAVWFATLDGIARVDADGRVTRHRTRSSPGVLTPGPDGAVWFADEGFVGRMDLAGHVTPFTRGLPRSDVGGGILFEGIATGPDGNLWLTGQGRIFRMTLQGEWTEMADLGTQGPVSEIIAGPDGNLWFVYDEGVGRITLQGDVRLTRLWSDPVFGDAITAGPDGNLWVSVGGAALLRVSTTGTATRVGVIERAWEVASGPDGNLWYRFKGGVGRVAPDGSRQETWREPFGTEGPSGGLAWDARGTLWGPAFNEASILRLAVNPDQPSPLEPFLRRAGPLRSSRAIAPGAGGTMWLAARRGIVRVDRSGAITTFRRGAAAHPTDVFPVRGGGAWFTFGGRGIGRLAADGTVRRFVQGFPRHARVFELALGADHNVWFIDVQRKQAIGRMTPRGRVREFRRGLGRRPDLLTLARGPGRRMWATDQAGAIVAISPSGRVRRFTRGLGRRGDPVAITRGPDGNLWFTEHSRRRIGRISPSGRVKLWRIPGEPAAIAPGPDGALWFNTDVGIGRITVRGRRREYFVRETSTTGFKALAPGPDGKIWFLEDEGPIAVARMDPRRLARLGQLSIR